MGSFFRLSTSLLFLFSASLCSEEANQPQVREPASLVNMASNAVSTVNGSVNVISGDLVSFGSEYTLSGPDPYVLGHSYQSSEMKKDNLGHGWSFHHSFKLEVFQPEGINFTKSAPNFSKNKYTQITLSEQFGGKVLFKGDGWAKNFRPDLKNTGYTNFASGELSGQNNLKNISIWWDKSKGLWHVKDGRGSERIYAKRYKQKYDDINDPMPTNLTYHIVEERRPSGNKLLYTYDDENRISKVKTVNSLETKTISWVKFHYPSKDKWEKDPHIRVETSDLLEYTYKLKKIKTKDKDKTKDNYVLHQVIRPGEADVKLDYSQKNDDEELRLQTTTFGDDNFLETHYYHKWGSDLPNQQVVIFDKETKKFLYGRVSKQKAPVGTAGKLVTTHSYLYKKLKNSNCKTSVVDPYGNRTNYYFNNDKRLTQIEREDKYTRVMMTEKFVWADTKDEVGNLLVHTIFDEKKRPRLSKVYEYDESHNVIKETQSGIFTGLKAGIIVLDERGFPDLKKSDSDKKIYRYTYSKDGLNLKLSERSPEGNYTYYEYKDGTNLLTARFTCDGQNIKKREFFSYDDSGIVIKEIVDDGSSYDKENLKEVSERHIKRIKPRDKTPYFGEPEEISEYYLDLSSQKESLLKRTVNTFSDLGHVIRKDIYSGDGKIHTKSLYEYDSVGRITYSKDPEGREEFLTYDKAGRLHSKRGPRDDVSYFYSYDQSGNLVKVDEKHLDGLTLTTRHKYDFLGRKVADISPQGNETEYKYDFLGRVVKIIYPAFRDASGKEQQAFKKFYYREISHYLIETDELGNQTRKYFNANGKLLKVEFPDGSTHLYQYDFNDRVTKHIAPNGLITKNQYDNLGRLIETREEKGSKIFSVKSFEYSGFHLVSEEGPTDETLLFAYDYAGRKVQEKQAIDKERDAVTTYVYDGFGRVIEERKKISSKHFQIKKLEYDKLNRITSESVVDEDGKLLFWKSFAYDKEGNVWQVTESVNGKNATTTTLFRPHGIPYKKIDAEGNATYFDIDYFFVNDLGQYVVKKTTTNAKGVKTEEIFTAKNELCQISTIDPFGNKIAEKKLFYDPASNVVLTKELAISQKETKTITTAFEYDEMQRLRSLIQAAGTNEQKKTAFFFNEYGQNDLIVYANGTSVKKTYDGKGRLENYFDESLSFSYTFSYDPSDRVLEAKNNLTNNSTKRSYNLIGAQIAETLETGITLNYSYDPLLRVTELALPDKSKISYNYNALFLTEIAKVSQEGKTLFRHKILERDLSGHVLKAKLANNAGVISYSFDSLNRLTKASHPHFAIDVPQDGYDPLSNLTKIELQDPVGKYTATYSYDFLNQLTSESSNEKHSYVYDSLYNRLEKDSDLYELNCQHAVLKAGEKTFRYDQNGNRIEKSCQNKITSYSYDALDRLISVTTQDQYAEYTYDAFNRRLTKDIFDKNGQRENEERFIYSLENEIGSIDSKGKITELRILGDGLGAEIGAACAIELNGKTFVPLYDGRGSISCLLSAQDGTPFETYRYTAFGEESIFDCDGEKKDTSINPWRFASKRIDQESGLIFFGRRFYDPSLGKWLTQDPLGLKAGPNLYAYVQNNPMTHFDLYGLIDEIGQAGASAGASERGFFARTWDTVRDFFGRCSDYAKAGYDRACSIGKEALKFFSGYSDGGRAHSQFHDSKKSYGQTNSQYFSHISVNGMYNTLQDLDEIKKLYLEILGPEEFSKLEYLFNATTGMPLDLAEIAINRLGISSHPVRLLTQKLKATLAARNSSGSTGLVNITAHSHGTLITHLALQNLTPEDRQYISVTTYGATKLISQKEFGLASAQNFIARTDPTTLCVDPINFIQALFSPESQNVTFIGSRWGLPFSSHAFGGKEYQAALRHTMKPNEYPCPK